MDMIKYLLSLFLMYLMINSSYSQHPIIEVVAGSYAPWGKNQYLKIDALGNAIYYLSEVNKGVLDSSTFQITSSQLSGIYETIKNVNFFKLDTLYTSGLADGSGIHMSVTVSGKKHTVEVINKDIPEMNKIVAKMNSILQPFHIRLNYGQKIIQDKPKKIDD